MVMMRDGGSGGSGGGQSDLGFLRCLKGCTRGTTETKYGRTASKVCLFILSFNKVYI